jgi:hypothetical protein
MANSYLINYVKRLIEKQQRQINDQPKVTVDGEDEYAE